MDSGIIPIQTRYHINSHRYEYTHHPPWCVSVRRVFLSSRAPPLLARTHRADRGASRATTSLVRGVEMTTLASTASPRRTIAALALFAVACGTCGASPPLDRLRDEDVGVSRAPPIENWRRADRTDPPPRPRPAPLSTASQTPFPAEPRSTRTCRSPTKNGRRVRARRRSSRQPRTSRKFELLDSAVPRPGGSTRLPRRSPRSTLSIPTLQTQRPPSGTPRPTCRSASRRIRPTRSRTSDSVRVTPTPERASQPSPVPRTRATTRLTRSPLPHRRLRRQRSTA